jgi:hypothetical protein
MKSRIASPRFLTPVNRQLLSCQSYLIMLTILCFFLVKSQPDFSEQIGGSCLTWSVAAFPKAA